MRVSSTSSRLQAHDSFQNSTLTMASRILTSVVTGASGGLGGALSKRLLQDGWHVAMIARSKDKMKSIVDSLATDSSNRSCIIGADLMDPKQCKSAHEEAVEWYVQYICTICHFVYIIRNMIFVCCVVL